MQARNPTFDRRLALLIAVVLLTVGGMLLLAAHAAPTRAAAPTATAAAKGVPDEVPCPKSPSRTGWEKRVPHGKSQSRNATCADCRPIHSYAACKLWWGEQSPGGGQNVDHSAWPGINGIHWQVVSDGEKQTKQVGTRFNDELLGRHHNDTLHGENGNDVLWGDSANVPGGKAYPHQSDRISGGDGDDWIYASKGKNVIDAGAGDDIVIAYNGHGTIDCGPGHDKITLLKKTKYHVKHCEVVKHPASKKR
jgi:hypothetical protein